MAKSAEVGSRTQKPDPRPPLLLDDVFLLLVAGLIIPTLVYIVWGIVSLESVPGFGR